MNTRHNYFPLKLRSLWLRDRIYFFFFAVFFAAFFFAAIVKSS